MKVRAYHCSLTCFEDQGRIINSTSAGKARYVYLIHIQEVCPDVQFKDIKVKSLGAVVSTEGFERIKEYRRVSNAVIGMDVTIYHGYGVQREAVLVEGGGGGAYFEVIFKDNQERGYVHPAEVKEFREEMLANDAKYERWLGNNNML